MTVLFCLSNTMVLFLLLDFILYSRTMIPNIYFMWNVWEFLTQTLSLSRWNLWKLKNSILFHVIQSMIKFNFLVFTKICTIFKNYTTIHWLFKIPLKSSQGFQIFSRNLFKNYNLSSKHKRIFFTGYFRNKIVFYFTNLASLLAEYSHNKYLLNIQIVLCLAFFPVLILSGCGQCQIW